MSKFKEFIDKTELEKERLRNMIGEVEAENLRRIFDTPIETDEDLVELSKLTDEED